MLWFHGFTDNHFLLSIVHSWMLCTQWTYLHHVRTHSCTYHMLPVRLLVCSLFLFTCLSTLPLWIVDSSMLTVSRYAYLLRLVDSSADSLFLDYSTYSCLYLYLPVQYIYDWDEDLFLIFNLLCNHPASVTCEIPRTLLVPSSSLAKATALRSVERSSFSFSLLVAYR